MLPYVKTVTWYFWVLITESAPKMKQSRPQPNTTWPIAVTFVRSKRCSISSDDGSNLLRHPSCLERRFDIVCTAQPSQLCYVFLLMFHYLPYRISFSSVVTSLWTALKSYAPLYHMVYTTCWWALKRSNSSASELHWTRLYTTWVCCDSYALSYRQS